MKIDNILKKDNDRLLFISASDHIRQLYVDKSDMFDNLTLEHGITPLYIKCWNVDNDNGYIEVATDVGCKKEFIIAIKINNDMIVIGNRTADMDNVRVWYKDIPDTSENSTIIIVPLDDNVIPVIVMCETN